MAANLAFLLFFCHTDLPHFLEYAGNDMGKPQAQSKGRYVCDESITHCPFIIDDSCSSIYSTSKEFHCGQIKEIVRSSLGISWNTIRHSIFFAGSKYKDDIVICVETSEPVVWLEYINTGVDAPPIIPKETAD